MTMHIYLDKRERSPRYLIGHVMQSYVHTDSWKHLKEQESRAVAWWSREVAYYLPTSNPTWNFVL